MLLPNNSHIDIAALNAKAIAMAIDRRRKTPLFAEQNSSAATLGTNDAFGLSAIDFHSQSSTLRSFVKQIPVIGPLARRIYQRKCQIAAPGLHWKQRLSLIPVVGVLSHWAKAFFGLHTTRQELHHFKVTTDHLLSEIQTRLAHIELRINRLDTLNIESRITQFDAFTARANISDIQQNNHIAAIKRELVRLTNPCTPQPLSPESRTAPQTASAYKSEDVSTDSFYIEFEDTFRGTREDITQRLQVYLPYLAPFAGDASAHMVDVGCGRGEWLGLLQQQGYKVTGIDLNPDMVDACRKDGLQAQCDDAIGFLRQQPEGSLALVTGFHIIEHLPFETLLALFDAALHSLRPDGLIIFETPNPENMKVGACSFYSDPTHLNPIVPDVAQFIARQRGFARAELLRLHPYPESLKVVEDSELAKRFNAAFYGPQDYAVLAWKNHAI